MQVGIDIVEIERFKEVDFKKFIEKYLTEKEMGHLLKKPDKYETIAGMFACKEAVLKAFKIGIGKGVKLKEVEIIYNDDIPSINKNETILRLMEERKMTEIDISISHSDTDAIAICVIK